MKKLLYYLMNKVFKYFILVIYTTLGYSYTINIDSADVIIKQREYIYMYRGGLAFGDIDNDGKKDMAITLFRGNFYSTEYKVFILWGDLTNNNIIIVNGYPYLFNNEYVSDFASFGGLKIHDINSDGYEDLIYSFPIELEDFYPYKSSICIKYGKPRASWSPFEYITTETGYDIMIRGIYNGRTEGQSLLICNCDDDAGPELISGSSISGPESLGSSADGHVTVLDFDFFPDSGLTYLDSIETCTILGWLPGSPPPCYSVDSIAWLGCNMINLGDLDGDDMEEFVSTATGLYYPGLPFYQVYPESIGIMDWRVCKNFIFWGRPNSLWRLYNRTQINPGVDSLLTLIYTPWRGQICAGDVDGDGYRDFIVSKFALFRYEFYHSILSWYTFRDTSKLYIVFGGPGVDSLKGGVFSANDIANVVIKSRIPCDGTGYVTAVGDFNGDGIDDFALSSSNRQDPGVIYMFFGNRERRFPRFIQDASLKIEDDDTIQFGDTAFHAFDSIFAIADLKMCDLNNDGIDELIAINMHHTRYYFRFISVNDVDLGYIFINKRISVDILEPSGSTLCATETLMFKINYKYPLKLSSIKVSINRDTFAIGSPRLEYISTDSILFLLPDSAWDSTRGYWICIQNITDTIGTPPDSLPLCFSFNGATTSVYEPPKPRTLSLTCYPNPFNAEVRVRLRMPDVGDVKIDIYDISGKLIDHIHKSKLTAGWHELIWRPRISVPSGVYLLKVSAGGEAVVRRVVMVR